MQCHLSLPTINDSSSRQFGGKTGLIEEVIQNVSEECDPPFEGKLGIEQGAGKCIFNLRKPGIEWFLISRLVMNGCRRTFCNYINPRRRLW